MGAKKIRDRREDDHGWEEVHVYSWDVQLGQRVALREI